MVARVHPAGFIFARFVDIVAWSAFSGRATLAQSVERFTRNE